MYPAQPSNFSPPQSFCPMPSSKTPKPWPASSARRRRLRRATIPKLARSYIGAGQLPVCRPFPGSGRRLGGATTLRGAVDHGGIHAVQEAGERMVVAPESAGVRSPAFPGVPGGVFVSRRLLCYRSEPASAKQAGAGATWISLYPRILDLQDA
jgi:hypothetical protein